MADNATFSLAVDRISHTVRKPTTPSQMSSAAVGQLVEHLPQNLEVAGTMVFFTCSTYAGGKEISYLGSVERPTPILNSLRRHINNV